MLIALGRPFVKRRFFFVFLDKLIHLAIFGTNLQISKICKFGKLEFLCISQRIGTFGDT